MLQISRSFTFRKLSLSHFLIFNGISAHYSLHWPSSCQRYSRHYILWLHAEVLKTFLVFYIAFNKYDELFKWH